VVDSKTPRVDLPGLVVELRRDLRIGSLRYFDAAGPLDAALHDVLGGPLPPPLKATCHPNPIAREAIILAWRSPTETLLLTQSADAFEAAASTVAEHAAAGCFVEQTGGLAVWDASGGRAADLLRRLGSTASVPALGEARVSRVAELPVLTLCVREAQLMMLVERVYSDHLIAWIGETAADLSARVDT
jgi:sarcosine oxidase gamma subunit